MDLKDLNTLVVTIGTIVGTLVLKWGVDGWLKIRKDRREDKKLTDKNKLASDEAENKQTERLIQALIASQNQRDQHIQEIYQNIQADQNEKIARLEGKVDAVNNSHVECVKQNGIITGQLELMIKQNKDLLSEVGTLREEVNKLGRHGQANKEHVEGLLREVEEKLHPNHSTPAPVSDPDFTPPEHP